MSVWRRRGSSLTAENIAFVLFVAFMLIYAQRASDYGVGNFAYFITLILLSVSLALIWGYAGILSFGQTAFFGVGGYLYGIYTLNYEGSLQTVLGALIGVIAGAVFAAILGYFMFYGGVNDNFVGLTMLALTLVLETFMAQTAGPEWSIGSARLNGYNGMFVPSISLGDSISLFGRNLLYFHLAVLVLVYVVLRLMVKSRWGHGLIALRENRQRTETFGYNVRLMQVQVFAVAGAVAALSGVLYASWGGYIVPSSMGLAAAVTPVIYVAIGGRKNLTASIVSSLILLWIYQRLASSSPEYALIIFGALALTAVLFLPEGFVQTFFQLVDRYVLSRRRSRQPSDQERTPARASRVS
jgi:branched-chain amino acid transport system permease protein